MIRVFCLTVLIVWPGGVVAADPGAVSAACWPNWRGVNHDGVYPHPLWDAAPPATLLRKQWAQAVGTGFSAITIVGDRLFTMGNTADVDTVYAIDAATGRQLWTHTYPCELKPKSYEGGPNSTPAYADGRLYTLSREGHVHSLNAADGSVIWTVSLRDTINAKPPMWGFSGSPLIHGEHVILNVGRHGIALDRNTGRVVWDSGKKGAGYATPVPWTGRDTVFVLAGREISAVNPGDGAVRWEHSWRTSWGVNAADPILYDGRVFISSSYNKGCVLLDVSGAEPKEVWRNKNMKNHFSSSVLYKGYLYGITGHAGSEGALCCIDFRTGRLQWSHRDIAFGSLMIAGNKLVVLTESGELVIADATPTGFNQHIRQPVLDGKCWTVPVVCGDRIYARNASGNLVCYAFAASRP